MLDIATATVPLVSVSQASSQDGAFSLIGVSSGTLDAPAVKLVEEQAFKGWETFDDWLEAFS